MNSQTITIAIDPGLAARHASLRSVCAQGVYQHGLKAVALGLNRDPGNLSRELADNGRHLSVDSLEAYIEKFGDLSPVFYLVERFLLAKEQPTKDAQRGQVLQQMQALMASLDR
jgi:hypothetical protein